MTSNERTKKEGERRRATRRKDAFSSQNDGNCSSNDGDGDGKGDMGGRDGAPFHARYFRPG